MRPAPGYVKYTVHKEKVNGKPRLLVRGITARGNIDLLHVCMDAWTEKEVKKRVLALLAGRTSNIVFKMHSPIWD